MILISFLFYAACNESTQAPVFDQGGVVLRNGLLIDGTGVDPVEEMAVVIQNGRIKTVGKSSDVVSPENATDIDLEGATILPGFINSHVHHGFNENNLKAWAEAGVTTVRDIGAVYNITLFQTRDALNSDNDNARLVAAGPLVTVPGGYPIVPWGATSAYPVSTVEEARQEVGAILDTGADLIKIALERGDIFSEEIPVLSEDMAAAIVQVTHERGTVVSAHILAARDLELVLAAGVDDIAHMVATNISGDQIDQIVQAGIYWVPTLELWYHVGYGYVNVATNNLRRFVEAGGKVALGTDYDGYNAQFDLGMPLREIGFMLDAGMTPMQIIVAGTKNAAHVCNLENELGTVEVGKIADILVVNSDPLEDIEGALQEVQLVIHNGIIIYEEDGDLQQYSEDRSHSRSF
jgi:imidazolonepropionase-like amidohydrolase